VNTNNGVKWRRFIVPKKIEKINNYLGLFIYRHLQVKKVKVGVNDMTVNDSEMSVR